MRDMASAGESSEACVEVKGMGGGGRETEGFYGIRERRGIASERQMVRGNRWRTGIKHKRGDRSLEGIGKLATRGRDESGCSCGRCSSPSSRGAGAIELTSPTPWEPPCSPSGPRSPQARNPTPGRTLPAIGCMPAMDRNSSIPAGRREASRGKAFDPRKSAPR